jgi:transposase-like protein
MKCPYCAEEDDILECSNMNRTEYYCRICETQWNDEVIR